MPSRQVRFVLMKLIFPVFFMLTTPSTRNSLLLTYHAIFTGPSSALHKDGPCNTRPGNTVKHKITKDSVASIAYIACQVRFAITSWPTFTGGGGKGKFNYRKFYCNIIMAVNEFMDNNEHLVFLGVGDEDSSETEDDGDYGPSLLQQMKALAEAQKVTVNEHRPLEDVGNH
ncbi:hypothetical protein ARMGADRAFT_1029521 [Armillaria gallica]|uniref:Uncharacterized protein n=1 Tax=Armillaria gallica TaxID=47427 RepID=A0A2H3DUC2_ARMGA|nr:hypothetical protein ARMGADRAFT_1029521 [Armillaria gallica]